MSKLTYGCYLAACLAYFSSCSATASGSSRSTRDIVDYVPPSAKHLQLVLQSLERIESGSRDAKPAPGQTLLHPPLKKLSESLRRRSLVVLISDLYEDPDDVLRALANLRGRGNDLIVFQLLEPREIDFSFSDASNFIDMETGTKMPIIPEYLRKQYRELVQQHTGALSKRIGGIARRLRAVRHVEAARPRAVLVPRVAAELQPGAIEVKFLAPAFLASLAAMAVPVIIHLIHRERRASSSFRR